MGKRADDNKEVRTKNKSGAVKVKKRTSTDPRRQPCTRVSSDALKDCYSTPLTFRAGQRGSRLLEVEGYTYVKNRTTDTKTYWICARKGGGKCQLRAVTILVDGVERLVSQPGVHYHPPAFPSKEII